MCQFARLTCLAAVVCPFLLVAPPSSATGRAQDTFTTARIGNWNIEWLGQPQKRGDTAKNIAQSPEDLKKYIIASKVDILGLNEIAPDGETIDPPTSKTLAEALDLVKKETGKTWKHVLFPKEDRKEREQWVGVAWNADRVEMVGPPVRVPIRQRKGTEGMWNRHPYAVKFSFGKGKTDVVLIPVHMKSNFGGREIATIIRAEEAKTLSRSLGAIQRHFVDDDVVILGDTNALKKDELALTRYIGVGLKDLNAADLHTWIKDERYDYAPFDRILVPDDQPEFRDCVQKVCKDHHLGSEPEFRKKLSDHYLIFTDIRVMDDDD